MEQKKTLIITGIAILVAAVMIYFFTRPDLSNQIIIPYVAHQLPSVDPHRTSADELSDRLDEVMFDGFFNKTATPSGVVYSDGLAELVQNVNGRVTFKLKPFKIWHDSYKRWMDDDDIKIQLQEKKTFTAKDVEFTINRIRRLGSVSPDYILISQAMRDFTFTGPNEDREITFQLTQDRNWTDDNVKEIFSFKVLPASSAINQPEYLSGTGPYMFIPNNQPTKYFERNPEINAGITYLSLFPVIDNSTYITELLNKNTNVMLKTPFGARIVQLDEEEQFFFKANQSTTFFTVLFNTQRVNLDRRKAFRKLIDAKKVQQLFYKIGTPQQRHITDYLGEHDQYDDYVNFSVFPRTSLYVSSKRVMPVADDSSLDAADSLRIVTHPNFGYREELNELGTVLSSQNISQGRIRVQSVPSEQIRAGNYDAILLPITGYDSEFLFDLYKIFLRTPDYATYEINLRESVNEDGERTAQPTSMTPSNNFNRLDAASNADAAKFLEYVHGFMSSTDVGDKQVYSGMIHQLEQQQALGVWLFSLPSLSYFSNQFDPASIMMYGTASQLSTVEDWKEKIDE